LAELPPTLRIQILVLTYSLRVALLTTHLVCNSCRSTAILTGASDVAKGRAGGPGGHLPGGGAFLIKN